MLYVLKDTCIDWFLGYICLSEHNDFGSLEAYLMRANLFGYPTWRILQLNFNYLSKHQNILDILDGL